MLRLGIASYLRHYHGFSKPVWLNIIAVFIYTAGFLPGSFLSLYLVSQKGISIQTAALFISTGSAVSVLGSYISGWLGDRYSPVKLAIYALLLGGIFLIIFPVMNQPWLILFNLSLFFFTYSIFKPLNNIILIAHCSVLDRPRVLAFHRMAFNLGFSIAMVIGGFLADYHFTWYFYLSGSMTLLATLFFVSYRKQMALPESWQPSPPKNPIQALEKLKRFHIFKNKPFMLLTFIYLGYCLMFYQVRMTFGLYMTETFDLSFSTFGMVYAINTLMVVFLEVPIMSALKKHNQIKVCMAGVLLIAMGLGMLPLHKSLCSATLSYQLHYVPRFN